MLRMVSELLPALAATKDDKKTSFTESNEMPNKFAARILECDVVIPAVRGEMIAAVDKLFGRRSPDTTGATEHGRPALRMKEPHLIKAELEELFKMRRRVEKDDLKAITDPEASKNIHNMWMHEWLQENLTEKQRRKAPNQQTSIFSAWLHNHYGSKRFVMAIIETGLSWATPSDEAEHKGSGAASSASNAFAAAEHSPDTDIAIGAPEHTITRFIDWVLKVAKAIDRHKNDATVQEQRRRSGEEKRTSGLTEHEKTLRAARDQARSNFAYGADLHRRVELHEGKGKSKGKGKRDHLLSPIAWHELSRHQQRYVREYRNGSLKEAKQAAEAQYHPRSGDTNIFRMD